MITGYGFEFITGFMVGLQYDTMPNGMFCIVLDLGFLRIVRYQGPPELFEEMQDEDD